MFSASFFIFNPFQRKKAFLFLCKANPLLIFYWTSFLYVGFLFRVNCTAHHFPFYSGVFVCPSLIVSTHIDPATSGYHLLPLLPFFHQSSLRVVCWFPHLNFNPLMSDLYYYYLPKLSWVTHNLISKFSAFSFNLPLNWFGTSFLQLPFLPFITTFNKISF